MKEGGRTLIELLVAIVLTSVIMTVLYGALNQARHQEAMITKTVSKALRDEQIRSTLFDDLLGATSLKMIDTGSQDRTIIALSTRHGLYSPNQAYVIWMVHRLNHTLIRLESATPIRLPLLGSEKYSVHCDRIEDHCRIFRLYETKQSRLGVIKFDDGRTVIVEALRE